MGCLGWQRGWARTFFLSNFFPFQPFSFISDKNRLMKVPNSYFFLNILKNRLKWIKNPNLHDSLYLFTFSRHRDIKHCFLVLSRDFSQYGSCAGSFYQEQKVANIGDFKIVSSEIPWKKMLKLALSLFLADLVVGNPTTKWRKRFFSTRRVWAKLFETVSNPRKNSFLKSKNQNLDFKGCVGKVPRF